jgi:hypothetical protein
MAVGLFPTLANAMLNLLDSGGYNYVQLHTGEPGPNGTTNIAAESDRILVDWGSASGGSINITADIGVTGAAATERWTHWTAWTASTAGTPGVSGLCTASQVTAGDDVTIDNTSVTVTFTLAS